MYIGNLVRNLPDVSLEYRKLAVEDEEAARSLYVAGHYRQAAYFFLQAMEKYVRSRIFGLVNPNTEVFRKQVRTHNLDELLVFLVEVVSGEEKIRNQVKGQLEQYVLGGVKFGQLHNNLRYPFYSEKDRYYSLVTIDMKHADLMNNKLQSLKAFLKDLDMLRR